MVMAKLSHFKKNFKKCDNLGKFTEKVLFLDYNKTKKCDNLWQSWTVIIIFILTNSSRQIGKIRLKLRYVKSENSEKFSFEKCDVWLNRNLSK